jgi:hypothetical protein
MRNDVSENIKLSFDISEDNINDIKKWLIKEYKNNCEGFYGNSDTIYQSFQEKQMAEAGARVPRVPRMQITMLL